MEPEGAPQDPPSIGGSLILSVFFCCYLGYEIWYQWDFKGRFYLPLAIAGLIITFVVLNFLFYSISCWIRKKLGPSGGLFAFFSGFLVMLLVSYFFNPEARHQRLVEQFKDHIPVYLNLQPVDDVEEPPILIGKIAVVETGRTNAPDIRSDKFQKSIRADTPDEVSTVVLLKWEDKKLPVPEGAVVETCQLTAIHLPTKELTVTKEFEADWREINHKTQGRIWSGFLDPTVVDQYIRNLPTRKK